MEREKSAKEPPRESHREAASTEAVNERQFAREPVGPVDPVGLGNQTMQALMRAPSPEAARARHDLRAAAGPGGFDNHTAQAWLREGGDSMGPAQGLDAMTASRMRDALGGEVGDVRVHTGAEAARLADEHDARAVTIGRDVAFAAGEYAPGTPIGDAVLAHELAHVAQQRGASAAEADDGASDALEADADRAAGGALEWLWRGGRALSRVGTTMRSSIGLRRCPSSRLIPQSHPQEKWPGGPTVNRKSTTHTLTDYVGWLREVEAAYGSGSVQMLQRLRRLYYSGPSDKDVGKRFDLVVNDVYGAGGDPMIVPEVRLDALNGLFETNAIQTPNGSLVDISHIFAGLDIHVQGPGFQGTAAEARFGVDDEGVLTWVGDLASWFVEAVGRIKRMTGPVSSSAQLAVLLQQQLVDAKAAKDDLLGDLDAQVMANRFTTTSTFSTIAPDSLPVWTSVVTEDIPLSEMLMRYYGSETPAGTATSARVPVSSAGPTPTSSGRFHLFVDGAVPYIPHRVVSRTPLVVALEADTSSAVREQISNTARLFLDSHYMHGDPADLTTYANVLDEVVRRFIAFLTTGLAQGDAPWP